MNLIAFILGILYLILGSDNFLWNFYGIFILVVMICNIVQACFDCKYDAKGYFYLAFSTLFMLLIPSFNVLFSFSPTHQSSRSVFSSVAILSLFVIGLIIAVLNIYKKKSDVELLLLQYEDKYNNESSIKKRIRTASIIFLSFLMLIGLAITYSILVINSLWKTEVLVSAFALFYSLMFLSAGVLIIKLLNKNKKIYIKIFFLVITLYVSVICLLPITSVPTLIKNAEISYINAFSMDYKSIPDFERQEFRQVKFSIPEYFFGTISKDFIVRRDIPFYIGTDGNDKDLRLYFDVYSSSKDSDLLPGGNSVLIRIHGGEWKYGDKGFMNSAQMNKYFASQGYVVFDIQYGLSTFNNEKQPKSSDEHRYGEFTTNDMVRHIYKFIKYLAENHKEFNANINSVFISGSSAGGNLALASGLAFTNNEYSDIGASRVNIRGIIPFYPANGLAHSMGVGQSEFFASPELLVNNQSPPCLIFQGINDGIVKPVVTQQLHAEYLNQENENCAIINMPYGGHSSDVYFSGYYNQVFLYYMERFMYQYR